MVRTLVRVYLRCYIVGSELRGHQVSLIDFGKAKVTQLHRCILQREREKKRKTNTLITE